MSQIDVLLGRSIAEQRGRPGVSQEDLARKLGLSADTVAAFERGDRRATAKQLFDIAEVLNVKVEGFFNGFNDEPFEIACSAEPFPERSRDLVGDYHALSKTHRGAAFAFLTTFKRDHKEEPG